MGETLKQFIALKQGSVQLVQALTLEICGQQQIQDLIKGGPSLKWEGCTPDFIESYSWGPRASGVPLDLLLEEISQNDIMVPYLLHSDKQRLNGSLYSSRTYEYIISIPLYSSRTNVQVHMNIYSAFLYTVQGQMFAWERVPALLTGCISNFYNFLIYASISFLTYI